MLFSIFERPMMMPTFVIRYHRAFYPRKALANFKGSPFSSLLSRCHYHQPPPTSPRRRRGPRLPRPSTVPWPPPPCAPRRYQYHAKRAKKTKTARRQGKL